MSAVKHVENKSTLLLGESYIFIPLFTLLYIYWIIILTIHVYSNIEIALTVVIISLRPQFVTRHYGY
jgi:hypothetical protein